MSAWGDWKKSAWDDDRWAAWDNDGWTDWEGWQETGWPDWKGWQEGLQQPDTSSAAQPATSSASQPATSSAAQPATSSAAQPATSSALQPATSSAAQTAAQQGAAVLLWSPPLIPGMGSGRGDLKKVLNAFRAESIQNQFETSLCLLIYHAWEAPPVHQHWESFSCQFLNIIKIVTMMQPSIF